MSLGVKRGSKVAIWATNVPAWYITFWAATKIGAVLVTVNTAYKIHEAEYLLRQSDTHTLVMIDHCLDSDYKTIIQTLCPELAQTFDAGRKYYATPLEHEFIEANFPNAQSISMDYAVMEKASNVYVKTVDLGWSDLGTWKAPF